MVLNPTLFAKTTRSSASAGEAQKRVLHAYRAWVRAAPDIQNMYSLNIPVAKITRMRQEYERHRYVAQLPVIDVLISKSDMEFQETMNYWKQSTHVLKYFSDESPRAAEYPQSFLGGFLEGRN